MLNRLREAGVGGSNPLTPTKKINGLEKNRYPLIPEESDHLIRFAPVLHVSTLAIVLTRKRMLRASRRPMGTSDPEGVAQWLAEYDAGLEADVARAERRWCAPPVEPQSPLPLTGAPLVLVPGGEAPEPLPGVRDRNWWRDLGRRTAVKGRERIVLGALLNRIWTGENNPREGRVNGQWCGFQREIQTDIADALGVRSIKYAIVGLIGKAIIARRYQGRRRAAGGGRGKSVYLILPSNPHERRGDLSAKACTLPET